MGYPHYSGDCDHSKCITAFTLEKQREWSAQTFGPAVRRGVVDHMRKELKEIEDSGYTDLSEWIDVMILAADGAWRGGATPQQIIDMFKVKLEENYKRQWPDWRNLPTDKAIEHIRSEQ